MSTSTDLLAIKLLSPFVFTGELQAFIMYLGFTTLIFLLILKVYYLFFYKT